MPSDEFHDMPDKPPPRLSLRNAVSRDVVTPAGRFTLLVDPASPAYVFVMIEDDWRKCIWLEDAPDRLPGKDAALRFLTHVSRSSIFQTLVSEEQHLQEEWDSL